MDLMMSSLFPCRYINTLEYVVVAKLLFVKDKNNFYSSVQYMKYSRQRINKHMLLVNLIRVGSFYF